MLDVCEIRRVCIDTFNDSLDSDFALDLTLRLVKKKNPCDNIFISIYTPDRNVGFELYTNFKDEVTGAEVEPISLNPDSLPVCWASIWARNSQLFSFWHYSTSLNNSIVFLNKALQDELELKRVYDKIQALITATIAVTPYTKLLNLNADDIAEINRLTNIVTDIADGSRYN